VKKGCGKRDKVERATEKKKMGRNRGRSCWVGNLTLKSRKSTRLWDGEEKSSRSGTRQRLGEVRVSGKLGSNRERRLPGRSEKENLPIDHGDRAGSNGDIYI